MNDCIPYRRARTSCGAALVVATALLADGMGAAHAGPADTVSLGWAHIDPHSTSGPLTLSEFGGQAVDQPQAGSGVKLRSARTLVVSYEHYWLENVSTQLALGVPPTHKLEGTGTLAAAGILGEGQQLSPALIFKFHFLEAEDRLRPFVGLGVNYTWFRKSRITNDAFRQAAYGPDSTTKVSVSSSWNPVYSVGVDYRLDDRWSIGASIAHAPLKARITVDAAQTSYGVPVKVITDVRTRTIATGVNVAYAF